tara:strand:- start:299 stop:613 length:315 start_codon:yes stop_codon:yes gene_type:complete
MHRRRISRKSRNIKEGFVFFSLTTALITCLIFYLWVYTEVDETTLAIEIQNATLKEFENQIFELRSETELLSRVDVISKKAQKEINMVFTEPEIYQIEIFERIN